MPFIRKIGFICLLSIVGLAAGADILDDIFARSTDSQRKQAVIDARNGKYDEAVKIIKNVLAETKNAPDILCDSIVIFKWAGKYEDALDSFSKIPKDYKIPDAVQLEMAVVYYKLGKPAEAALLFEKYLPKNEKDVKLVEMMVLSCIDSGNSSKALVYLEDRSKSEKEIPQWLNALIIRSKHGKAVETARAGRLQEAISNLGDLITQTGDRKSIYYDYIVILSWDRQYEEAIKKYAEISQRNDIPAYALQCIFNCYDQLKDKEGMLEVAKKLALSAPLDQKNLQLMLQSCELANKPEDGIATAEALIRNSPDSKETVNPFLMKLKLMLAVKLARNGEHAKSLEILEGLLKENENDAAIMSNYILVLSWAGKKEEAKKIYDEFFKDRKPPEYLVKEMTGRAPEKTVLTIEPNESTALKESPADKTAVQDTADTVLKYLDSGKIDKAIDEVAGKLSNLNEKNRDYLNKSMSMIREKAIQAGRNGKCDEAIVIIDKLLGLNYEKPSLLADKIIIMVWAEDYASAIDLYSRFKDTYAPNAHLLNAVGTAYRRTGKYHEAIECYEKSLALDSDNPESIKGKVFSLVGAGQNAEAETFIKKESEKLQPTPKWLMLLPCEACIVGGRYDDAGRLLKEYLGKDPDDKEARKMLVEVRIHQKTGLDEAMKITEDLIKDDSSNQDLLFLKVTLLQLSREYIAAYDFNERILSINKFYRPSINAKYHILLDMKAAILADQMLRESGDNVSYAVKKRLMGDLAAEQLSWKDYRKAIQVIDENIQTYDKFKAIPEAAEDAETLKLRARFDRILALFQGEKMAEIIKEYESLKADGIDVPSWLRQNVAAAYLYCRHPDTALAMYREIHEELKKDGIDRYPDNYIVLQGIYSCLIELEDQSAAYDILEVLEKETPAYARPTGVYTENSEKLDLGVERGWWYIYNDQLPYAEEYLSELIEKAPYNSNIRTAIGYLHYYRGWSRLALEDFQISTELDPNDKSAQIGLAYTLNENDEWEKARTVAAELAKKYPEDLDVKELQRSFELQEKRTLTVDSNYSNAGNFSDGSGVTMRLEQPIYPERKIYAETLWLYTSQPKDSNQEGKRRNIFRGAIGFDWRLSNGLYIFGEASLDYHAREPGFMAGLRWKPTDHLTLSGFYNSYTLNMPPKALLFGKKGQEANISAEYRFSEDLIVNAGFSNVWVSDGNINQTYSWKIDKGIWSSAYWKFRIAVEGSTTTNTKIDTDYYSPRYYTSVYFVPMVEHLWYRRYETSIVDRLFLGIGPHWEKDYTCKAQYYLRYEQEYQLTDYFGFKIGGKIGKERYGDDNPCAWGFYGSLIFKF